MVVIARPLPTYVSMRLDSVCVYACVHKTIDGKWKTTIGANGNASGWADVDVL